MVYLTGHRQYFHAICRIIKVVNATLSKNLPPFAKPTRCLQTITKLCLFWYKPIPLKILLFYTKSSIPLPVTHTPASHPYPCQSSIPLPVIHTPASHPYPCRSSIPLPVIRFASRCPVVQPWPWCPTTSRKPEFGSPQGWDNCTHYSIKDSPTKSTIPLPAISRFASWCSVLKIL
jgi:hypothetical protein